MDVNGQSNNDLEVSSAASHHRLVSLNSVSTQEPGVMSSLFKIPVPSTDLYSLFWQTLQEYANKTAVEELFGEGRSLTFYELEIWSEAVASQFHDHGLSKHRNDKVAIYSPNCIEFELVVLATQRLGLTLVTVNYMSTADELSYYMKLADVGALITAESVSDNALKAASVTPSVQTVFVIGNCRGAIPLNGPSQRSKEDSGQLSSKSSTVLPGIETLNINPVSDVAFIQFSSGTTGMPKAVSLTHTNIATVQLGLQHESFHTGGEYRLVYQPMSHIFGLGVSCETLITGTTLLLQAKFNLQEYLTAVAEYKIKMIHVVPPIATMMAKMDISRFDLSALRTIMVASAPLSSATEAEMKAAVGNADLQVVQAYGLTETTGLITMTPYSLSANCLRERYNVPITPPPGSCGLLFPNTQTKVIDLETGKAVGPNVHGEIVARGPLIMAGYHNNPEATAATIDKDGWLHTGDIGYYDENGYFFIVDRQKELIKYNGFQVAPAELEALILQHPGVADVGVIGIENEQSGELPHAWVVCKAGTSSRPTERDVIDWVAGRCAPYKWLRGGVKFVTNIPRSPTGKILRRTMRETVSRADL